MVGQKVTLKFESWATLLRTTSIERTYVELLSTYNLHLWISSLLSMRMCSAGYGNTETNPGIKSSTYNRFKMCRYNSGAKLILFNSKPMPPDGAQKLLNG